MDERFYQEYAELEKSHWWFTARLEILKKLLTDTILPRFSTKPGTELKILNAGVATGGTTFMLNQLGEVTSLEYDRDCCQYLESVGIEPVNASLTELPFADNSFDIVCSFDVIEHIADHEKALSEIKRVLTEDGQAFITVPAFMFLWSHHDDINHHERRYTKTELEDVFKSVGFDISFSSYFNTIMFLPILFVRMVAKLLPSRGDGQSTGSDGEILKDNRLVNSILHRVFAAEKYALARKISFPVGVSALVIASKEPKTTITATNRPGS